MKSNAARTRRPLLVLAALWLCLSLRAEQVGANESEATESPSAARRHGWLRAKTLTGDWLGWRSRLKEAGVTPYAVWMGEVFRNFEGGLRTATDWAGLLEFGVNVDLEKAIGWRHARFHASAVWLQDNDDPSADYVGNFDEVSNIAGERAVRAYRFYLSQGCESERLRIKLGQLVLDDDFMVSTHASLFLNASFGAMPIESVNSPAPIYPLAALGGLAQWRPNDSVAIKLGVYNGDAGSESGNRHGFDYDIGRSGGVMTFIEVAVESALLGRDATYKLGGYHDSGETIDFDSGRTTTDIFAIYAIVDQTLIGTRENSWLAAFFRVGWSPLEDRSQVHWYLDAGLTARGFRAGDRVGLGVVHARFGDAFVSAQASSGSPIVGDTTAIELTYSAQLTPWFVLQPDLQIIIDPQNASASDAFVGGLRATITF